MKSSRAEGAGDAEKRVFSLAGRKELGFVHTFFPLRIGYTDYGYKAALMRDARLRIN